jgi:four helix bundle protein
MKTHRDLDVWKGAMELVLKTYNLTRNFPKEEKYCLTDQIRRAIVSVPSNISEGAGRASPKELKRFLYISMGSLSEFETLLLIANKLGYINTNSFEGFSVHIKKITAQLSGLIKSIKVVD